MSGRVFPMKGLIVSKCNQALHPKEGNVWFSSSQIPRVVALNYIFAVLREGVERKLATVNSWGHIFHQCKMNNNDFYDISAYSHRAALDTCGTWCLTKLQKRGETYIFE